MNNPFLAIILLVTTIAVAGFLVYNIKTVE